MKLEEFIELSANLSTVRRYSQYPMNVPESVLEHTGFVSLFTLVCSLEINNLVGSSYIDIYEALTKAIVHDISEVVTGDIPRPTKYASPGMRDMFKNLEEEGVGLILSKLGLKATEGTGFNIYAHYVSDKKGLTGLIVAVADFVAVVYKVWFEALQMRNSFFLSHIQNVYNGLTELENRIYLEVTNITARDFLLDIITQSRDILTKTKQSY